MTHIDPGRFLKNKKQSNSSFWIFLVFLGALFFSAAFLYIYDAASSFIWIFGVSIVLVEIWYFRKNIPILIFLIFTLSYVFVPFYYFMIGISISPWPDYQTPQLINLTVILNILFFLGLFLGIRKVDDRSLYIKKYYGLHHDRLAFVVTSVILVFILFYGIQGDNIFTSGGYGSGKVEKTSLHEYFIVFFLLAVLFASAESRFDGYLLTSLFFTFVIKTLIYGGRIEVLELAILTGYIYFNFFRRHRLLLLFIAILGFAALKFFGEVRGNSQLLFSLHDINVTEMVFRNSSQDVGTLSGTSGDVTQSSVRILGLLFDGRIDFWMRLESFFLVVFGAFVPASLMPEHFNLSKLYQSNASSGGGGLVATFSYIWLGFFGPLVFGRFIGFVVRSFYLKNSVYWNIYGLMVLISFPRWFAYYPVVLFKFCFVGVCAFFAYSIYSRIKSKSVARIFR